MASPPSPSSPRMLFRLLLFLITFSAGDSQTVSTHRGFLEEVVPELDPGVPEALPVTLETSRSF